MSVVLLKNLGVKTAIIDALQKSYGPELEGLEIGMDKGDLKLFVRGSAEQGQQPGNLTIHHFFEDNDGLKIRKVHVESSAHHYNCHDTLKLLSDTGSGKANLKINGQEMKLSDSLWNLLRCLAIELKETNIGWVYVQDLREKGVIPSEGYQPFNRLRSAIAGYLLDKNPKDFIESNGRKQYRISADPANIEILEEAKK